VLLVGIDIDETMFGESCAKEVREVQLADNTVRGRISDISKDLCDQLIDQLKKLHVSQCKQTGQPTELNMHI
jgi:hypothetical protein